MVAFVGFVEFNWKSAKAVVMTIVALLADFVFFFLVSLFVSLFFLPDGLMPVPSSYSSFCFIYAEVICSSSACMLFLAVVLFFLNHILQNRCRLFLFF